MFHHQHTTGSRRHRAMLLTAAVLGYAAGTLVTRRWRRRELAAALTDANHDPLTGLPNRRAAATEVTARLAHASRFLLALVDLDDFKSVNDTHGHPAGDDLLAVVAARLYVAVPPGGFVARLGGDEFLVLLPDHGGDPAKAVQPVLNLLTQPVRIGAATLQPRACIGVVTATTGDATQWRQLIAQADQALYQAKTTNGPVAVYHPHLDVPTTGAGRPRSRRRDHRPPPRPPRPTDVPRTNA